MNKSIPLASPDIQEEDIERVVEVLRSGMLVQNKNVSQLEQDFSEFTGAKYCVAVSNGTVSLHMALLAYGIGLGDEVIVPCFTYVATANAVTLVGARCVFVDVRTEDFNIDVSRLEESITPRTKAIIPVHEFGLMSRMDTILDFARKHNLVVIEDAACALGATYKKKHSGTFGNCGSFSFHPRKAVTSGEGGMLITDDADLAEKFRVLRNHGISMKSGSVEFVDAGLNYRMTDFQAALLLGQLRRLRESLRVKRNLAGLYDQKLRDIDWIELPTFGVDYEHAWQSYHIIVKDSIDRDDCIQFLQNKGIGCNYGAQCVPAMDYYRKNYELQPENDCPNAWRSYSKGIALPLHHGVTPDEIEFISNQVKNYPNA